jgi:hypothetical protein
MPSTGTSVGFEEPLVTSSDADGVSASPIVKARAGVDAPAFTLWSARAVIVGAVFTGAETVSTKAVEVFSVPSDTVTVIVALPVCPAVLPNPYLPELANPNLYEVSR